MNCDRALEALLDSDLPELVAGSTPLAAHVRGCERCRRVADAFMADTRLLAAGMPAVAARRRPARTRYAVAPLAAAAALVVMVSLRGQAPAPVVEVASMLAPVVVDSFPRAPVAAVAPRVSAARALRAYPRAVPMSAVKLARAESLVAQPAAPVPTARAVSVTPPAGTRAVVMQTSDPKLVVVWLY
jgi:hypothetical protein